MKKILITFLFLAGICAAKAQEKSPDTSSNQKIFVSVQQEPTFPGGMAKFYDYVKSNMRYPAQARDNGVQGKVFVSIIVERDGSITNPKVLRGIGNGCDEEAIRLFKDSPKWNPGIQNGYAVRVSYIVPITFKL